MNTEELMLEAHDGTTLVGYRWAPVEVEPRAAIQIAHGMAEHAARYTRLAEALVGEGYVVYAHDHRGHGNTAGSDDALGWFAAHDGWTKVVGDLDRINRAITERHPKLPRCLFGHSMGSFMTMSYLLGHSDRVDAAVLSGSNVGGGPLVHAGRIAAKFERLRQGPRGESAVLAFLSFGSFNNSFKPTQTEFDWLSRDAAEVDKYIADPRCGFRCSNQLWVDFLGGLIDLGKVQSLAKIRSELPIHVFSGSMDPVSANAKGIPKLVDKLQRAGLTRVTHKLYKDGRHEMLNERNRDEVTADLIAWLASNLIN